MADGTQPNVDDKSVFTAGGRTLAQFRDPETGSLWPAEEKLVEACRVGEVCNLSPRWGSEGDKRIDQIRAHLSEAKEDPSFLALAAEYIGRERAKGKYSWDRPLAEDLKARFDSQPQVLRALLEEFPSFAKRHSKAPSFAPEPLAKPKAESSQNELQKRAAVRDWMKEGADWKPVIGELFTRFSREARAWRAVDLDDKGVQVRAEVLRVLALACDGSAPIHEKGIQLRAGRVVGVLDLTGASNIVRIDCENCYFDSRPQFRDARVKRLRLTGTRIPGMDAVRCRFDGSVFIDDGFRSDGQVWLTGVEVAGSFNCDESTMRNRSDNGDEYALNLANATIAGDVYCSDGFHAEGGVTFSGANIRGDLSCNRASFRNYTYDGEGHALQAAGAQVVGSVFFADGFLAEGRVRLQNIDVGNSLECTDAIFCNPTANGEGKALSLQSARIASHVLLRQNFKAEGQVWLAGAEIGGVFDCQDGVFENLVPSESDPAAAANALALPFARIGRVLWLAGPSDGAGNPPLIKGSVDLEGAHAKLLKDEFSADKSKSGTRGGWPAKMQKTSDGKELRCNVVLDSFTYERLTGMAPTDAKTRRAWLRRMPPSHLAEDYRPQPFIHLATVLQEMGHPDEARSILKDASRLHVTARLARSRKRVRMAGGWWARQRQRVKEMPVWVGLQGRRLVLDKLLGGGFGFFAPFATALVLLCGGWFVYEMAAQANGFVPRDGAVWTNAAARQACAGTPSPPPADAVIAWTDCKIYPRELPKFVPLVYSADLMLPLINLGQKAHWRPRDEIELVATPEGKVVERARMTTIEIVSQAQQVVAVGLYLLLAALAAGWIKKD